MDQPFNCEVNDSYVECTDDLSRACAELANCVGDTSIVVSQIPVDGGFFETKAAQFVTFCDTFEIPVLTLTNTAGFKTTKCCEKKMAKAFAKLTYVFANATVPKVNVIIGKAFGSA